MKITDYVDYADMMEDWRQSLLQHRRFMYAIVVRDETISQALHLMISECGPWAGELKFVETQLHDRQAFIETIRVWQQSQQR